MNAGFPYPGLARARPPAHRLPSTDGKQSGAACCHATDTSAPRLTNLNPPQDGTEDLLMEFELAIANTQLQMEAMAARLATCVSWVSRRGRRLVSPLSKYPRRTGLSSHNPRSVAVNDAHTSLQGEGQAPATPPGSDLLRQRAPRHESVRGAPRSLCVATGKRAARTAQRRSPSRTPCAATSRYPSGRGCCRSWECRRGLCMRGTTWSSTSRPPPSGRRNSTRWQTTRRGRRGSRRAGTGLPALCSFVRDLQAGALLCACGGGCLSAGRSAVF